MFNLDQYVERFRALARQSPGLEIGLLHSCLGPENLRVQQRKMYNTICQTGITEYGLSPLGLTVFGHCKTASTAYWFLMGGQTIQGEPLEMYKEKLSNGDLHFWLQSKREIIDVTKAQLSLELYPDHQYQNGNRTQIGSNQGKSFIFLGDKKIRIDQFSYKLIRKAAQRLDEMALDNRTISSK